ncbi:MAG: PRC-barrel domain-containing protein [Pseudomonadota bacterium]|nr:PRC-barrel domain-containing protein [Pseudomonadota bacterium]
MSKTPLAAGLAVALLFLGPALAQDRQGQFIAEQPSASVRLSKLKGVDVIGQDHTKLGDIEEVVIGRDGRVHAVVVGAGGVLGLGGKSIALPYDQILWNSGDVSRAGGPSASLSPEKAPPADPTAVERMPGAKVSDQALNAVPEGRSGAVDPGTGPVTTGATAPATTPVMSSDGPERAFVRLTKAEIESAPEFRYAGESGQR